MTWVVCALCNESVLVPDAPSWWVWLTPGGVRAWGVTALAESGHLADHVDDITKAR